jgi:hypothetical protein
MTSAVADMRILLLLVLPHLHPLRKMAIPKKNKTKFKKNKTKFPFNMYSPFFGLEV